MPLKSAFFLSLAFLLGCTSAKKESTSAALESISSDDMKSYISVLASDDFGGRAPATPGEEKTISYLAEEFSKIGLQPANSNGYFQEVKLLKLTPDEDMKFDIRGKNAEVSLESGKNLVAGTPQPEESISIMDSDVIFVGYGIIAPEYGWNDYEGIDVKGKTILILVNDPGYATGDTSLFTGKAMTYYGRWTYKFEEAARQGAAAALVIHETGAAGYQWSVVQNTYMGQQFYLEQNDFINSDLLIKGWITTEAAAEIAKAAGFEYEQMKTAAARRGFRAASMGLKASVSLKNKVEHVRSHNVAALWPGTDSEAEYVIYTSHWDHFGTNPELEGDSVYNGAVDNATGTAALLEIAEAFTKLPEKPRRSLLFLAVTAEEQNLLGSSYYATFPLFPLSRTAGVINMDALNIFGPTKDMTIIGYGNSELDNYAEEVLKKYGRYATPDQVPEKGGYFRSDHFSFARAGVPSLYLTKGSDNIEHGREWALKQYGLWTDETYHKTSDNYQPDQWNFEGMINDIKVYFEVGYDLSMTNDFPEWSPKFPFKAIRDSMMNK